MTNSKNVQHRESSAPEVICYLRASFFSQGRGGHRMWVPQASRWPLTESLYKSGLPPSERWRLPNVSWHYTSVKGQREGVSHPKESGNVGRAAWVRTQLPVLEIGSDNNNLAPPHRGGDQVFPELAGFRFTGGRETRFYSDIPKSEPHLSQHLCAHTCSHPQTHTHSLLDNNIHLD